MKKFNYRAMDKDNKKREGQYEANSREEVIGMITSNGYYPLKVTEVETKPFSEVSFNQKVTSKDLSVFCRQMYTMLDAGVTITAALNMLTTQIVNKKLRSIIIEIEEDVKKGEMLSESMKKYPNEFPTLLTSMVQSGEATGNIDAIMLRMSIHFEKSNKTNNKVKSAMIYPIALGIVSIGVIILMMVKVLPVFVELFSAENMELPMITKFVMSISKFVNSYILAILFIMFISIVGFNVYRKTEKGKYALSSLYLKLPVIADLNKKIITARFTRTMSTLLSSGISLIEAIPIVSDILVNKIAQAEMLRIRERVVRGDGLSGPISESVIFPELLSSMIRIGEESGSLDDILNKTADFYEEEVDQAIETATGIMSPLMIIVLGGIVGTIVVSIMLPMFDMYQNL